jgi:hypothetical protein
VQVAAHDHGGRIAGGDHLGKGHGGILYLG